MARAAHRSIVRRSLPTLLALLLAFVGAAQGARFTPDPTAHRAAGSAATSTTPSVPAISAAEPDAVPVEAVSPAPLAGARERVLRSQLVVAVRAARAPPAALI
ncbi:hypothetical protein ACWKSP_05720 [Micromonosporaceae bacterium Da 78-11]